MSQVTFKANEKSGEIITVFPNAPERGYVTLQSSQLVRSGTNLNKRTRTFLMSATVEILTEYVAMFKGKPLPGQIVAKEFLESELPANFKSRLNKKAEYEDAIAPFIKRAGQRGPELTLGGERILRFTDYDESGDDVDTTIAHDNVEAIAEWRAEVAAQTASLPA